MTLIWGLYVQNFNPLASKLKEEFEVTEGHQHTQIICQKILTVLIFLTHTFALLTLGDKSNLLPTTKHSTAESVPVRGPWTFFCPACREASTLYLSSSAWNKSLTSKVSQGGQVSYALDFHLSRPGSTPARGNLTYMNTCCVPYMIANLTAHYK